MPYRKETPHSLLLIICPPRLNTSRYLWLATINSPYLPTFPLFSLYHHQGAETSCVCVCTKRVCVKFTVPKVCTAECRYIQYIGISVFVQSRRVHLFIVNCLFKNKFNIHVVYYLYI